MVDPSDAMKSFEQALRLGTIVVDPAWTDPKLFVHFDSPLGSPRYAYARLQKKTVTAMAIFAMEKPFKGKPCFAVGYAVPPKFQNEGRAKEVLSAAISDMKAGLLRNGFAEFYLEAIVGADNLASRRVAEELISQKPKAITEGSSGLPAFKYVRRIK